MMRVLFLGDVVGSPGRAAVIGQLAQIKKAEEVDFIIINGENAAGGRGITPRISIDLLRAGAAVVTTGDHVWDQRDILDYFPTEPRLLRPINFPAEAPGQRLSGAGNGEGESGGVECDGADLYESAAGKPFNDAGRRD
jgi:calcineurin-like phosphoesterase